MDRSPLQGLCVCLKGSFRMITLFCCLIAIALKAFWFFFMKSMEDKINIPQDLNTNGMYTLICFLILILLYGSWSLLYNRNQHMKIFSLVTAVYCVILIILMVNSIGPRPITDYNDKLVERMKAYAKHYYWDLDRSKMPDNYTIEATKFWDDLQSKGLCCGIRGIETWDETRPKNVPKQYYPPSCCDNPTGTKWCEQDHGFRLRGCIHDINIVEDIIMLTEGASIAVGILVSVLTFIASR